MQKMSPRCLDVVKHRYVERNECQDRENANTQDLRFESTVYEQIKHVNFKLDSCFSQATPNFEKLDEESESSQNEL